MDVEVSDEMVEAIAQLFDPDAWHPNLKQDGRGVYWHSRRFRAREKAKATIPLIASQVEAATIERCAEEGRLAVHQESNRVHRTSRVGFRRPAHSVDYAKAVYTAIRSLSEGEKG